MRADRYAVVSVLDPAIDTERMLGSEMREYIESRDLRKLQPFLRPGVKPTVFHVREVPHELWENFVMAGVNESDRYRRAFMCGVERIDELAQNDGTTLASYTPATDQLGVMRPESLVRVSAQEREEIGAVVWYHSFLARRIERCFRVPHSSLDLLEERPFRRAAASPNSLAPSSDAASSQAASAPLASTQIGHTSESNGVGSVPPTAATAPAIPTPVAF